jgi:hypothetical protein
MPWTWGYSKNLSHLLLRIQRRDRALLFRSQLLRQMFQLSVGQGFNTKSQEKVLVRDFLQEEMQGI